MMMYPPSWRADDHSLSPISEAGPLSRLGEWLRASFRGAWGEHGAWAVGLVSVGAGLVMARSPDPAVLLLLPAVALSVAAKGLATRYRRTRSGLVPTALLAAGAGACALPAALKAPLAVGSLVTVALPFAVLYFFVADSPRWTRSLAMEAFGTLLLASSSGLPIAVARSGGYLEALCAWAFFGLIYMPGILRARIPKTHQVSLKIACTLAAAGSLGLLTAFVVAGRTAWWSLIAAPPIVKEAYRAWALPDWSTRELGLNLTLKAIFVALVVSLAWQPGPLS